MAVTKLTLVVSPKKMRNQGGYAIIFPQAKRNERNLNTIKTSRKQKPNLQRKH